MELSQLLTRLVTENKTEECINALTRLQDGLPSTIFQERITELVLSFQSASQNADQESLDQNILNEKTNELVEELTANYTAIELDDFNELSKELHFANDFKKQKDFQRAINHYNSALEIAKKHQHLVIAYCEKEVRYCRQELDNPYHSVIENVEETEVPMAASLPETPTDTIQNSFATITYNAAPVPKTDKKIVNNILQFANEEDQLILDKAIINYDNLLPIYVLKSNYKGITVNRKVKKRLIKRKGDAFKVLQLKKTKQQPSASFLKSIKNYFSERTDVVSTKYATIENLYPFNFDKVNSHDWFLLLSLLLRRRAGATMAKQNPQ